MQLPLGFHYYTDNTRGGWSIAVPDGWRMRVDPNYTSMVYFYDPTDQRKLMGVDTTRKPPTGSAVDDWLSQEAARKSRYPNYERVFIREDNFIGETGADWQYRYDTPGGRQHVSNLGFRMNPGLGHAIYWKMPESMWADMLPVYNIVRPSFRPATYGSGG